MSINYQRTILNCKFYIYIYIYRSYCDMCHLTHRYIYLSLITAVFIIYAHLQSSTVSCIFIFYNNILYWLCILTFYTNIIDTSLAYFIWIFLVDMFYIQWFCNFLKLLNVKINSIQFNSVQRKNSKYHRVKKSNNILLLLLSSHSVAAMSFVQPEHHFFVRPIQSFTEFNNLTGNDTPPSQKRKNSLAMWQWLMMSKVNFLMECW